MNSGKSLNKMKKVGRKVKFNVRGEIFETYRSTLRRFPETLLGQLNKRSELYSRERDEYVLDRSRVCFGSILYYYQTCILSCPLDVPIQVFVDECQHFQLPQDLVEDLKTKGEFSAFVCFAKIR